MSSRTLRHLASAVLLLGLSACDSSKPTPVGPTPAPTAHPTVTVTSLSVVGETRQTGFAYTVVVHLRESAGVAATITAVDLTFAGTTTTVSSHHDQPISAGTNVCPASGTIATRELVTVDADPSHAYASTVQVKVTYTDGASFQSTATGAADVPALTPAPPTPPTAPATYSLTGTIRDTDSTAPIEGARVEALNGANAGKAATTDKGGAYSLSDLVGGTFRMRASAPGYDAGEQNVTVPDTLRADMSLRRTPAPAPTPGPSPTPTPTPTGCVYSVSPTGVWTVPRNGGDMNLTVTRAAGTCSWRADSSSWIGLSTRAGSGDVAVTLTASVGPNASYVERVGTITIAWDGGQVQLTVDQAHDPVLGCSVFLIIGGVISASVNIPATGGQYTVSVALQPGVPPAACTTWTAATWAGETLITLVGPTTGPVPGSFAFSVPSNPTHNVRIGHITVSLAGSASGTGLQINQAGAP